MKKYYKPFTLTTLHKCNILLPFDVNRFLEVPGWRNTFNQSSNTASFMVYRELISLLSSVAYGNG